MARLFGTDGIRSEANRWPLVADFVLKVGQAAAQTISRGGDARPQVLIGRDPRQSGHMLESALTAGLTSQGVDVMLVGVITTPGVAYLTRMHHTALGVVISASHNPFDHNGIKIFGSEGFKIPDETELEIERLLLDSDDELKGAGAKELGRSWDASPWRQEYVDHLVGAWEEDRPLRGKRIVMDCSNGAASAIAPEVFQRLGADVVAMENEPDGVNINEHYEYIRPESLRTAVLREKAFVGIAFDGDADRVMLVDEKGGFVNGDAMMAILARDMKQKGQLTNNAVVSTPMSNWGLKASLEEAGIRLEEASVGDRFVLQRMIEENYALGGEQSGHIIMLGDGQTTGDGIYTALAVLKVVAGKPDGSLSALASCIREFPECLVNIEVSSKPPLQTIPEVQAALQRLHEALGENIDVTLRYSGTEDKLRLKIRAGGEHEQQTLEREAKAFMAVAKQAIG
ncbi:MAG: phosphoglucosamine mutase [Anaerolineae bacterium]|nr:phosphoglucosamine mutase [Anaerolineae bacterium]